MWQRLIVKDLITMGPLAYLSSNLPSHDPLFG
jgi:hypothetical protein